MPQGNPRGVRTGRDGACRHDQHFGCAECVRCKHGEYAAKRDPLEPGPARGSRAGHAAVGEHRDYTPAHDRDHEQDQVEPDLKAEAHWNVDPAGHREVKREIRATQAGEQQNEEIVAPIAARKQRNGNACRRGEGKCRVGRRRKHRQTGQHAETGHDP